MKDWRATTSYIQPQYVGTVPMAANTIGVYPQAAGYYQQPNYFPQHFNQQQGHDIRRINDWLCWSILNLIFAWSFFGFLPLIFSIICRSKKKVNDYAGASSMSKLALIFNIIITILGIIAWVLFIVLMVLYFRVWKRGLHNIDNFHGR